MAQLNTSFSWSSGDTVTAAKLNQYLTDATVRPGIVTEQSLNSSPAVGDQFLVVTAAGSLYRETLAAVGGVAAFNANQIMGQSVSSTGPSNAQVLVFDGTNWVPGAVVVPDGGVATAKLADDAVTAAKIAANAVTTTEVMDGQITAAKLGSDVGTTPVGAMMAYGGPGTSPPSGWFLCDGATKDAVSDSSLVALWNVIGTTYGGTGQSSFNLPDLRGRVPVGEDGTAYRMTSNDALGQTGGEEKVTLTTNEIPDHDHSLSVYGSDSEGATNRKASVVQQAYVSWTVSTASTGGGQSHENMPPYQIVNWIIRY